ncbi:uncharacterized protein BDV14DRAFT_167251 [Aspergillus stella-maris]|uniref:uncharacterized protein n=1 Tax=Aspergillus stella-maris TaxID=1810926 RepID=UPI003CCD1D96
MSSTTNTKEQTEYLPRHLRVLFTLSIQAQEFILAESALDHALHIARTSDKSNANQHSSKQVQYPQDELHWLATSAFNRAVEFFLLSKDSECARWASKAIALADRLEDDQSYGAGAGALGRLLRTNFSKLGLKST